VIWDETACQLQVTFEVAHIREGGRVQAIATCETNGTNPGEYRADVLLRVQTHPAFRIDELLPHNWVPPRPEPSA